MVIGEEQCPDTFALKCCVIEIETRGMAFTERQMSYNKQLSSMETFLVLAN